MVKAVEVKSKKNLAMGVTIPNAVQTPLDYLKNIKEYTTDLSIMQEIDLARKIYRNESICGTAIDFMVAFALTDVRAERTGEKELDAILNYFNDSLNKDVDGTLPGTKIFMKNLFLEYLLSGNPFPYENWQNIDSSVIKGISKNKTVKLPTVITLLDPLALQISKLPFSFNKEVMSYTVDKNLAAIIRKDGRAEKQSSEIRKNLPNKSVEKIRSNKNIDSLIIELDPYLVTHIKRNSLHYQLWGIPLLVRVFPAVALLKKLRRLDEVTTEGLINLITIFKIGTEEHPASQSRLQAFARLLNNPKSTTTLVWAHDVDVKQVGPEGKVLGFKTKYEEANLEMIKALGFPLSFIDQASFSKNSIIAWQNMLEEMRMIGSGYLQKIYTKIAENNGYPDIIPKPRWSKLRLSEELQLKAQLLSAFDRGILSRHTTLTEAGWDYNDEVERKTEEKKDDSLFLPPELPFSGSQGRPGKGTPKDSVRQDKKTTVNDKSKAFYIESAQLSLGAVSELIKEINIEKNKLRKVWGPIHDTLLEVGESAIGILYEEDNNRYMLWKSYLDDLTKLINNKSAGTSEVYEKINKIPQVINDILS